MSKPDNEWQEEKSISKTTKIQNWTCTMIYVYFFNVVFESGYNIKRDFVLLAVMVTSPSRSILEHNKHSYFPRQGQF